MDMEFKKLTDLVDDVVVNATAAREHVGDIEREIRTMRDRSRSTTSELPYSHCMPDPFIVYLIKFIVMWLNAFASDSGASNIYSPREIVTRMTLDYTKHCQVHWGSYIEAHDDPDIINMLKNCTSPCIALGPTGNFLGSIWAYNLETKAVTKC